MDSAWSEDCALERRMCTPSLYKRSRKACGMLIRVSVVWSRCPFFWARKHKRLRHFVISILVIALAGNPYRMGPSNNFGTEGGTHYAKIEQSPAEVFQNGKIRRRLLRRQKSLSRTLRLRWVKNRLFSPVSRDTSKSHRSSVAERGVARYSPRACLEYASAKNDNCQTTKKFRIGIRISCVIVRVLPQNGEELVSFVHRLNLDTLEMDDCRCSIHQGDLECVKDVFNNGNLRFLSTTEFLLMILWTLMTLAAKCLIIQGCNDSSMFLILYIMSHDELWAVSATG